MSETAEQRTKRKFSEYLDMTTWTNQYSFFYQDTEDAKAYALGDATRLKERLRRTKSLKGQPFLYRLCLYRSIAFHTIFTTKSIDLDLLECLAVKISDVEIKVRGRELPDWKLEKYRHAVAKQKPHNLAAFFGGGKINRIALLNSNTVS